VTLLFLLYFRRSSSCCDLCPFHPFFCFKISASDLCGG